MHQLSYYEINSRIGPTQMYQVTLKPDFCGHEKCTFKESEEVSRRYQREFINAMLFESAKLKAYVQNHMCIYT